MSLRKAELVEIESDKDQASNKIRSQKFAVALSKTIEKYVISLRPSMFQNAYSEIHEHFPTALDSLHNQLQTQLSCYITSSVRKICISHQVILFIENPERVKGIKLKKVSTHQRRKKKVIREPPKESKNPQILEKLHFRDNLLKKLKKMEAESTIWETTMFKNHDNIVELGEKIKRRRDLLLKSVEIMGDLALSDRTDLSELTLLELSEDKGLSSRICI